MTRLGVLLLAVCVSLLVGISGAQNATGQGKALNVPASQFWDGNDGPWSTFRVGIGEPTQQMRLLPASGESSSIFVFPEACAYMALRSGENCDEERGGLYMRNKSRTWDEYGNYELNTYLEKNVGLYGVGLYGFDTLDLGWPGDGAPSLQNQSIAGIISPNFTLGSLALSARPVNFSDYNNPSPSLLQNLRNSSTPIPSLSWSYTAGAFNQAPKIFGSLVLGGYDSARLKPNNLTFPFGADISSDLQVAIQRVTVSGGRTLLTTPIISYISTLVPDIWLPSSACAEFVKAFNLAYSMTTESYLISEDSHKTNLANNPVVTFQIGPEVNGPSTTIDMPYWNFYLAIQPQPSGTPTDNAAFRFPLKCASSDLQYVLGRAFLQSAYLTKDYERKSFNLSQALYPSGFAAEKIVSILPPGQPGDLSGTNPPSNSTSGLSTGAIAAIAVGAVIILAVIVGILYLIRRRKQRKEKGQELEDKACKTHEVDGNQRNYELQDGAGLNHELVGDMDPKVELSACREQEKPAEIADTQLDIYELAATERRNPVEMEGEGHVREMPS